MTSLPIFDEETIKRCLKPMTPVDTGVSPKLEITGDIQAVLFDIYGTLFISGSGDIGISKQQSKQADGLIDLMDKFRIKGSPDRLMDRLFKAIEKTHEELKDRGIDYPEVNIDRVWKDLLNFSDMESARAFALAYEVITNPVYPMPNLRVTIEALSRTHIRMGIVSNAQFYTPFLFEWFLGKSPFELGFHPDLTIYSYQHNIAKPSGFLFNHASDKLAEMGIRPGSSLYIGNDMLNDIYTAGRAGFKTALFAGDKRSLRQRENDPRCRNIHPDIIVTDLIQLINLLT